MSLLGMPWVVVNLGCEMLYILEQRLKAQGVADDKKARVLADIAATMFDPSFLQAQLFVPQAMYSVASTRAIFDRLAHASIMRLSTSSMDKLFDLMMMGAKYQLLCSATLQDMLQVMLRHLGTAQAILTTALAAASPKCPVPAVDAQVIHHISAAEEAAVKLYGSLSMGQLALLRHTLARFFQDKRVKVSLFLAEGIQRPCGRLVLPSCVRDQVGLLRRFDGAGQLVGEERLQLASQQADPAEAFCHPVPLGDNLYRKDRPKVLPPQRSDGVPPMQQTAAAAAGGQQASGGSAASQAGRYADEQAAKGSKAAAQELGLLVALVKAGPAAAAADGADTFKLTLFDDELPAGSSDASKCVAAGAASGAASKAARELQFASGGGGSHEARIRALAEELECDTHCQQQQQQQGIAGDELLQLMDSLAA